MPAKKYKVGDTLPAKKAMFIRLPDGSVVSAGSGGYTFRHAGEHVVTISGSTDTTDYVVEGPANPTTPEEAAK